MENNFAVEIGLLSCGARTALPIGHKFQAKYHGPVYSHHDLKRLWIELDNKIEVKVLWLIRVEYQTNGISKNERSGRPSCLQLMIRGLLGPAF